MFTLPLNSGRSFPMNRLNRVVAPVVLLAALVAVAGCGNTKTKPISHQETAPATTAGTPTAQITATPALVSSGDQVQLSWSTTNAGTVSIDGIGDVPRSEEH